MLQRNIPSDTMVMIRAILRNNFTIESFDEYTRYGNSDFDIIVKNKSNVVVRDKRDNENIVMYNNIKIAYDMMFNSH